jgi:ADP-ribose pyrophosphatase YjhB (NUDIX family)
MSREYPERPVVGVGAIIWRDDKVLLVRQEKYPELAGAFWTLPGGAQEIGETVEQALRREVREETGLEIEIGPLVFIADAIRHDPQDRVKYHYTVLDFRCEWVSGEPRPGSDAVEVRWVARDELVDYRTWDLTREVIRRSRHASGAPPFSPTTLFARS